MLERLTPEQRWPRVEGFLHSVLEADAARVFKVLALGGSLTTGMNCRSTAVYPQRRLPGEPSGFTRERACAWPARVGRWLRSAFPGKHFEVANVARPAWGTQAWALEGIEEQPCFQQADLVITELAVNAERTQEVEREAAAALWSALLALPQRPAVVALEVAKGIFSDSADADARRVQFECPRRAEQLHFVGAARANRSTNYTICRTHWQPAMWHAGVCASLRVPLVSVHDAWWPREWAPDASFPIVWDGYSHPSNRTNIQRDSNSPSPDPARDAC
jgi:hypothetical protein